MYPIYFRCFYYRGIKPVITQVSSENVQYSHILPTNSNWEERARTYYCIPSTSNTRSYWLGDPMQLVHVCKEYSSLSCEMHYRKGLLFVKHQIHAKTSITTEKSINVQSKPCFQVLPACRIKSVAVRACYFLEQWRKWGWLNQYYDNLSFAILLVNSVNTYCAGKLCIWNRLIRGEQTS